MPITEIGAFDAVESVSEIEKLSLRRAGQNTQGSDDFEAFAAGSDNAILVIHQQQICMKFDCKRNSILFAGIEFFQSDIIRVAACRLARVHPVRERRHPVSDHKRRFGMSQLIHDDRGQDYSLKQCRKDIDVPDEQKVIDWAGIGDDEAQSSESQPLKRCDFLPQIVDSIVHPNLMGLEEAIELVTGFEAE